MSYLELNDKSFFTKKDIKRFFDNEAMLKFYIHKLKKKKRVVKINKEKFYLVPVKAFQDHWSDNPLAIKIENSEIARSHTNYFNMMWETAKK